MRPYPARLWGEAEAGEHKWWNAPLYSIYNLNEQYLGKSTNACSVADEP